MKETTLPLFSVVICTYNRADLLRDAIKSLLEQDAPPEYEIIIVDNNSTDDTAAVVQEFQRKDERVRYCHEEKVGLSHARNRGLSEARNEYIAYMDDDCIAPPMWLSTAALVVQCEHPSAFGGPYYAFYNVSKPAWFKDEYGSYVQGTKARLLQDGEYLSGMNIFLHVDTLKRLDGFDPELGMKGDKIAYGEETELLNRLREHSCKIFYAPDVFVYHLVRPEKLKLRTNLRVSFAGGYYYAKILGQPKHSSFLRRIYLVLVTMLKIVKSVTWDILWRDRRLYPFVQNYIFEVSFALVTELGIYTEQLREGKTKFP